ncbi:MAG: hypothetical protein IPL53_24435 [Ignavibacteria bacterium]|nr:hypothetical protein [Ignavibacteria bacterium]
MKNDFIPMGNADLDSFESNLVTKLIVHAPVLGLKPDEVTEAVQIINEHRTAFTNMTSKKSRIKISC